MSELKQAVRDDIEDALLNSWQIFLMYFLRLVCGISFLAIFGARGEDKVAAAIVWGVSLLVCTIRRYATLYFLKGPSCEK